MSTTFEAIDQDENPYPTKVPGPEYYSGQPAEAPEESLWKKITTAKTGEGSTSEYIEHPLNWSKSESIAKIIRGATGLLGSLDLAIVDIIVGIMQMLTQNKGPEYDSLGRS